MPRVPGLSTVSCGLRTMYAGLCIIVLCVAVYFGLPPIQEKLNWQVDPDILLKIYVYGVLGGWGLVLLGQFLCLAAPATSGAVLPIIASILLSSAGVAYWVVLHLFPNTLPEELAQLKRPLPLTIFLFSAALFLMGLRRLAEFIHSEALVSRAKLAFVVCGAALAVWIALTAVERANPDLLQRLPELGRYDGRFTAYAIGRAFAVVAFLLYANLLTYLSRGLREYQRSEGVAVRE
jgi:hypothetical protein